ncbi:DUF4376 domain-containing protein [Bradyrhizobium zhanjiangense]|uniref:DUF4376 domain-containing protein n=1 Tax=Bradyrhizobium zhanjiangense TaxID=1325107 RepID=A0ABY0DI63_9BRAD|nr:DUF4376 domain-containing protein [Bradyrhizobium zhanjiangense]RXG91601.1 DUF4376 domain-containing protein [Bradyrhizobium zhanjiangense]
MIYDPNDWYWRADDGRVFASARQITVDETDADFIAFAEQQLPSSWPRDESGEQTYAELQRVLFPFRIAVDLKAYAFYLRDQVEHDGCPTTGITGMTEVRTDLNAQSLINRYHQAAAVNGAFTVPWVLEDRSTVLLDKAAIDLLFDQTSAFIAGTYTTYGDVIAQIDGGTITTIDQIDQAFGASLQRSRPVDIGWKS